MREREWRDERDDRTLRYAERRLDPNRWIVITAEPAYMERYEGQVALLTATNLLSRMSPSIALSIPQTATHPHLPWRERILSDVALSAMRAADPFGRFCIRAPQPSDYRLHLGREADGLVVHGVGWNAFVGPNQSPLPDDRHDNPIGAALAGIVAVSQVFVHDFQLPGNAYVIDALSWQHRILQNAPPFPRTDVGDMLILGVGSVGTAALYFLALAGVAFAPTLLDMDVVKIHNLDRSPIFVAQDVGALKIDAARRFLSEVGMVDVPADAAPLHESRLWLERCAGSPDIVIAAANEMQVRYHVEARYPPIQVYGTTGLNWQASVIRHIPFVDACSCCLFPTDIPTPTMACATAPSNERPKDGPQVDAALPFLSFAAGLMTVAEVLKLSLAGYPFSPNRVTLSTRPGPRLVPARIPCRRECVCGVRSHNVHRKMLEGSKYAGLSHDQ